MNDRNPPVASADDFLNALVVTISLGGVLGILLIQMARGAG